MSALGEVVGGKHTFEHGGKVYTVSLFNDRVLLDLERALYRKAVAAAGELRPVMDPADYRTHLKGLADDYLAGEFSWGRKGAAILQTTSGILLVTAQLFGISESEMLGLLIERGPEVAALLDVIIRESFPSLPAVSAATPDDPCQTVGARHGPEGNALRESAVTSA